MRSLVNVARAVAMTFPEPELGGRDDIEGRKPAERVLNRPSEPIRCLTAWTRLSRLAA
jgi:hypothetical protein